MSQNEIRLGAVATLHGAYSRMGEDGLRGARLAVAEFGGEVAGREIIVLEEGTTPNPEDAYYSAQKLVDEDGAEFVFGSISGNEGLAIRNYAIDRPDKTIFNGASGSQNLTFPHHAPNYFNFMMNGLQVMYGVGTYACKELGYRSVVTVGADYSYPWGQVGAFALEFCREGGKVLERKWLPLSTQDFAVFIENIPDEADAVMAALSGRDATLFLEQYAAAGIGKPLIGGSVTVVQAANTAEGALADTIEGSIYGSGVAVNNPYPEWQEFCNAYTEMFPDGPATPSWFAVGYYSNVKAALLSLEAVDGDLSDGHEAFRKALADIQFNGPCGPIRLDKYHQIVGSSFMSTIKRNDERKLYSELIKVNEEVDQMLGTDEEEFAALGLFGPDNPPCK